jgi:alpha-L-rhamnosidase
MTKVFRTITKIFMLRNCLAFLFFITLLSIEAQPTTITQLEVDKLINPVGLDTKNPDFSWIIKSEDFNVNQTHYQLFVATDKVFSNKSLVWDSGKVTSSESLYVKYQGKPLEYATKYYWTVKVWTNQSSRPKQSKISSWTTGLMDNNHWKSDWIGVNKEDERNPKSPYFTNDFVVGNKITSANLFITSRGIYEAHINGKRVGKSYLTPGWTSYNNRIQYQAYDVKEMLSLGDNRLGVILADGWFRNFRPNSGKLITDYGDELSFITELVISFEDGTKKSIINDENWNYHFGAIQSSSIYNGEFADFNLSDPTWSEPKKKNGFQKGTVCRKLCRNAGSHQERNDQKKRNSRC